MAIRSVVSVHIYITPVSGVGPCLQHSSQHYLVLPIIMVYQSLVSAHFYGTSASGGGAYLRLFGQWCRTIIAVDPYLWHTRKWCRPLSTELQSLVSVHTCNTSVDEMAHNYSTSSSDFPIEVFFINDQPCHLLIMIITRVRSRHIKDCDAVVTWRSH